MKPYSILGMAGYCASLLVLTGGLAVGVHAQNNTSGQGTSASSSGSSTYKSDRPCGGLNALTCPGGLVCVDDPSDNCDPTQEGAKCGGFCVAGTAGQVKQPCGGPKGLRCPASMECVDDASDKCDPTKEGTKCMGFCVAGVETGVKRPCAGPSAIPCPGGMTCVDDPSDKCDPTQDGINCKGFCAVDLN